MYYLQSRYYDPEIRRFISADTQLNGSLLGKNMFCYCENNPINGYDPSGHVVIGALAATIGEKIFAGVIVAAVSVVSGWLISNSQNIANESKQISKSISAKITDVQKYLEKSKAIWALKTTEKEREKIIAKAFTDGKKQAFFRLIPIHLILEDWR